MTPGGQVLGAAQSAQPCSFQQQAWAGSARPKAPKTAPTVAAPARLSSRPLSIVLATTLVSSVADITPPLQELDTRIDGVERGEHRQEADESGGMNDAQSVAPVAG